jgi:hypothetical protein
LNARVSLAAVRIRVRSHAVVGLIDYDYHTFRLGAIKTVSQSWVSVNRSIAYRSSRKSREMENLHFPPALLALPPELVLHIFSFLPSTTLLSMLSVNTNFAAAILSCIRSRIHIQAPMASSPIYLSFVPPALAYARRSAVCTHVCTPGLDKIDAPSSGYDSDSDCESTTSGYDSDVEQEPRPLPVLAVEPKLSAGQDIIRRVQALYALRARYSVSAPTIEHFEPNPRSMSAPAWTSEAPRFAIDYPDERFTTALARIVIAKKGVQMKWAVRLFRSWLNETAMYDVENEGGPPSQLWFGEDGGDGVVVTVERSPARTGLLGWQREDPDEEWYQLKVQGRSIDKFESKLTRTRVAA